MIKVKRIYKKPDEHDGFRILVDRLWPRGISKDEARVDLWFKEVAPSSELRKWFAHDPQKWEEFKRKYREELKKKKQLLKKIKELEKEKGIITLLFSARDEEHNNAVALREILKGS